MRIHAIKTGTVQIKNNQRIGKGSGIRRRINMFLDRSWTEPLPIYAWVIEHREGVFVVDTGDTAKTSEPNYLPRFHPYYRYGVRLFVEPDQEIGPQLDKLGIRPNDVKTVIMTHFHTDHSGGMYHFPKSKFLANGSDYSLAKGLAGKIRGYLPHRWPTWLDPQFIDFESKAYGPFAKSYPLTTAGDIRIVPTPGHTPGHMSVIAEDSGLFYFLAGDTSYTQQIMLDGHVDGVSPDETVARQTLDKIRMISKDRPVVYLPSHDPEAEERLAGQKTIDVQDYEKTVAA